MGQVLAGKGPRLILDLPLLCYSAEMDPLIMAVMRHMLEDPNTLQAAMEAEIKNTLNSAANRNRQTTLSGSTSYGAGMWGSAKLP